MKDCEIYHCEQRSSEWMNLRKGVLTASNFGAWLLAAGKAAEKARESAICKLISERAGCWQTPDYQNAVMQRGEELEPQAVKAFEKATGKKVIPVGFCRSIYGAFGASPDGLIEGESAGMELKVPVPSTHIQYRRAGVLPEEYKLQVHGCMAVTGADRWYFQSWSPNLASLRVAVRRDDFTEELKAALIEFSRQFQAAWEQEKRAAKEEA